MTTNTLQINPPAEPVLVVLGVGADQKPHAARFASTDKPLVVKAAAMMQFHAIELTTAEHRQLADKLPIGKVFATGRGFVPYVRGDLYDRLVGLIGTDAELTRPIAGDVAGQAAEAAPLGKAAATVAPTGKTVGATATAASLAKKVPVCAERNDGEAQGSWADIVVGFTVLARDSEAEAWYEAIVLSVALDDPNVLRLRWRDYPDEAQFRLHRNRLALIGPGGF